MGNFFIGNDGIHYHCSHDDLVVIRSIQRADRKFERENEEYENAKKKENER